MVSLYEVLGLSWLEESPQRGSGLQVDPGNGTKAYPHFVKVEQVHAELKRPKAVLRD
jgi:hypothetical protein